jgi:hypothetical protein
MSAAGYLPWSGLAGVVVGAELGGSLGAGACPPCSHPLATKNAARARAARIADNCFICCSPPFLSYFIVLHYSALH